jgi:hypothetical protein
VYGRPEAPDGPTYFIRFVGEPQLLDTIQPDPEARVVASTNLPDGTLVIVTYTEGESFGYHCCSKVNNGMVHGKATHTSCRNEVFWLDNPPSRSFTITFTVLPDTAPNAIECLNPEGCARPQPRSVLNVLGERFERLNGPQVRMKDGMPALVASKTFPWPAGSYASEL